MDDLDVNMKSINDNFDTILPFSVSDSNSGTGRKRENGHNRTKSVAQVGFYDPYKYK